MNRIEQLTEECQRMRVYARMSLACCRQSLKNLRALKDLVSEQWYEETDAIITLIDKTIGVLECHQEFIREQTQGEMVKPDKVVAIGVVPPQGYTRPTTVTPVTPAKPVNVTPDELRAWRKAKGWTLGRAGQCIGVSASAVGHWERGSHIPWAINRAKVIAVVRGTG